MTTDSASPRYACERADLARHRDDILAIWGTSLTNGAGQNAKYGWFYQRGEAGPPVVALLRHPGSGRHVGVAAAGRRRARWNDADTCIGVLVDLAVEPEHRSLYPAMLLQRSLQQAVPAELAALYGFPNPRAAPVFLRVGYSRVLDSIRFARVLRSGRYLERHLPRWAARPLAAVIDAMAVAWEALRYRASRGRTTTWSDGVDASFDALWAATDRGPGPVLVRDARFLGWRFEQMPGKEIRFLRNFEGDARLAGWFACEAADDTLVVRDFWTRGGFDDIDCWQLRALLRAARAAGYAAVSLEFGGSERIVRALHSAGFSERGRRPFFAYFGAGAAPGDCRGWYVTNADEDE